MFHSDAFTLLHSPGTTSSRVLWLIYELQDIGIELNCNIEYVDIYGGEVQTHKMILNPKFNVPKLIIPNRESITTSISIVLYLSGMYPLLNPSNRMKLYEYAAIGQKLDEMIIPLYYKVGPYDPQDVQKLQPYFEKFDKELKDKPYFGDFFTIIDVIIAYPLSLAAQLGLLKNFRSLDHYVERNVARKSYSRSLAPEEEQIGVFTDEDLSAISDISPQGEDYSLSEMISPSNRNSRNFLDKLDVSTDKRLSNSSKTSTDSSATSTPTLSTISSLSSKLDTFPTLYHVPGHRSAQILWLLSELKLNRDVDYKLMVLGRDYKTILKSFEYLRMNPDATVPILKTGKAWDQIPYLWETGPIIQWFIRRRRSLVPDHWKEEHHRKNDLLEYWCLISFEQEVIKYHKSYVNNTLERWWLSRAQDVVKGLIEGRYVHGDHFTISDIYLGYALYQLKGCGILDKSHKKILQYYLNIRHRPAFKEALRTEM